MTTVPNQPKKRQRRHFVRGLISTVLVLLFVTAAIVYGPTVVDMVRASQFHPNSQLASVKTRLGLTDRATWMFYATAPAIEDKTAFNTSCKSTERTTAILGCYYKDRIYLYNIQNTELDGTLEVTAAHEMLHAAYQRLNIVERTHVDKLIDEEYQKIKNESTIKELVQYYQQAEPGAEKDELHSIIGTTIKDLPDELEQYYATYFSDRASVVALNESYNKVFNELSQRADTLQKSIDAMRPTLESDLSTYNTDLQQLNLDIESFNQRANSGGFTTQAEFQTARAALVVRVNELNSRQAALNTRIAALNADITALNEIAVRVTQLNESINGVSAPTEVN